MGGRRPLVICLTGNVKRRGALVQLPAWRSDREKHGIVNAKGCESAQVA